MYPVCMNVILQVLYKAKGRESKYAKSGFIWIFTYELKYNENTYTLTYFQSFFLVTVVAPRYISVSPKSWS